MKVLSVVAQPRLWYLQKELQDIGITSEKNYVLEGLKFRAELLFVHQMRESSSRNCGPVRGPNDFRRAKL